MDWNGVAMPEDVEVTLTRRKQESSSELGAMLAVAVVLIVVAVIVTLVPFEKVQSAARIGSTRPV